MRVFLSILAFLFLGRDTKAHIGSSTVFFEGDAGPYKVRVSIQPPDVVPGRARINVRVHDVPATRVTALPVRWDAGKKGAPPPDAAVPVEGEPGLFSTELWLMDFGAYSVFVDVEGERGKGTAIVPLNSVSTKRLPMPGWMAGAFLAFGGVLLLLLVALVGAGVRESILPAGAEPDQKRTGRARYAMCIALLALTVVLSKGKSWWDHVDAEFRSNRLYKPVEIATLLEHRSEGSFLQLNIEGTERDLRDRTPLVADHGKLMHLFVVKRPEMDALAHLHPVQVRPKIFESPLPQLPSGEYDVYADITHESGLTQTLVGKLKIDAATKPPATMDLDNSAWVGTASSSEAALTNGLIVRMLSEANHPTRRETVLRFDVLAADGKPAPLEPYMGMWSHAVIRARDGSVYTHIHPAGTISMTSQELFARRERGEDLRKPIDIMCGRPERELTFPYSFPTAGSYRIWVQVKVLGEIQTAAFDLNVVDGS